MKKLTYALLLITAITSACNDDFLERYPLDELTPDEFFHSAEELQLYANRFYTLLPAHQDYSNTFWIDNNSDNLVPAVFNARLGGTRTLPASAADGGWNWSDIRQANYFLAHCDSARGATADLNHFKGEVRFFRALLYFEKVKTFGAVPWIGTPLNTSSADLYTPRTPRNVVVDSILADLDLAINWLKTAAKAGDSRIHKDVARLLKARVCLYEGTWEKYHAGTLFGVNGSDGTHYLQLAEETADGIIQTNAYRLFKGSAGHEYSDLFIQTNYTGNPEVLLWKKFDIALQVANNVSRSLSGGGGNTGLSKGLIDSYLCTDGKPVGNSPLFGGYHSQEEECSNRDPRLKQTLFQQGYDIIANAPGTMNQKFTKAPIDGSGDFRNTTGYSLYKGVNADFSQQANNLNGTTGSIIFRYAEALLILAEAKAELGTISQGDLDRTINLLRDRVGMPHLELGSINPDPNWDFPALSPIINEIRRERRIELACEGSRWDDLARWRAHSLITGKRPRGIKYLGSNLEGTYRDYLGNPTIKIGENLFVDGNGFIDPYQQLLPSGFGFNPDRDYLSPIPSDELTLNSKLTQNPGW